VICGPHCVCWPDGAFDATEQRFLAALDGAHCWLVRANNVGAALRQFSGCFTKRRLAHLLCVPLTWAEEGNRIYGSLSPLLSLDELCRLFPDEMRDLPLCPHGGRSHEDYSWPSRGPSHHPGRMTRVFNVWHYMIIRRPILLTTTKVTDALALGAYPACGCVGCSWNKDFLGKHLVPQWHRWFARSSRRLWCAVLA
jgi:hypothetical protein